MVSQMALDWARQHCRANVVEPYDVFELALVRDELGALTELTNYFEVVEILEKEIAPAQQCEYRSAVQIICVGLIRRAVAVAIDSGAVHVSESRLMRTN